MRVLSLFDGISGGQLALKRASIPVEKYYASEVDNFAIKITQKNFPETIQLGDITKWESWRLPKIDLLIAGSPCQGFSFAGKQLNFDDNRSKLFFQFVDILCDLKLKNPDIKFLLENVKMKKEYQDVISKFTGVQPIEINSALLSAQNRKRLYWTNILNVTQPRDKGILLKGVVFDDALFVGRTVGIKIDENGIRKDYSNITPKQRLELRTDNKSGTLTTVQKDNTVLSHKAIAYMSREIKDGRNHWDFKHHSDVNNPKSAAVVANFFKGVPYNVLKDWNCIRKFDPIECERLQTYPDNYTEGISNTQRYKAIGNSFTVDVIAHILRGMK
jgi:DNA-cytosine methyltransferase